jgi:LysR family glycine cleavage system transcriptional activator
MNRRLPPLNALRAFEAAARTGSFTLAAQELQVSQSAISHQIAHLEEFLGIKLFERHARQVKLTREGTEYSLAMATAFEMIEHETYRLSRSGQRQSLRIKAFPTFTIRWLLPRLGAFHALHPDIDVQITTSMVPADLSREDVDLTLEHQNGRQSGARYDHLFDVELVPVCSARLIKGPPPIERPEDLLGHVLLHGLNRLPDWKLWLDANGLKVPIDARGLRFGNSHLVYQAAANGIGVAIAQPRFVEDDISTGRLIAPFPTLIKTDEIYYLVSLPTKIASPVVATFREWLLSETQRPLLLTLGSDPGRA